VTDKQTDVQTSCDGIVRAMHTRRAVKTVHVLTGFTSPTNRHGFSELSVTGALSRCCGNQTLNATVA